MSALEAIIKSQIKSQGAMDMGAFMALALGHPEQGYYNTRDPFGVDGDFITAPEVSQMFGEMIGAWVADCWGRLGAPARFVLLECGPGRGTLMADVLRAAKGVEGFLAAAEVHLLEMSPVLRAAQEKALGGYEVTWHDTLESVPEDAPIIVVANEFFDALPARQLVYQDGGWYERVIGLDGDDLVMGVQGCPQALWPTFGKPREGDVFEFSPARESFMSEIAGRIKAQTGAGLVIDYGYMRSGFNDTIQSVSKHKYADILSQIGEIDVTSHVDFEVLGGAANQQGVSVERVVPQGDFLRSLGIEMRAQALKQVGDAQAIEKDLQRLIGGDQMGDLFKVMGVHYGLNGNGGGVAGF